MSKNVFVDTKDLNRIGIELKGLEKQMPGAVASALNRTVDHVSTQLTRKVTEEYRIKAKDVRSTIKKIKAKKGNIRAGVISKGHTLSIAHFPHTPGKPGTKRTIKVEIKRGIKKEIKVKPSAFIAPTGAKSEDKTQFNVFKRVGKKRLPIVVLRTLSVPQMISNNKIQSQIQKIANTKLSERVDHEISWRLSKLKK